MVGAADPRFPVTILWMVFAAFCTVGGEAGVIVQPNSTESTAAAADGIQMNSTLPNVLLTVQPSSSTAHPDASLSIDNGCTNGHLLSLGTISQEWRSSAVTVGRDGSSAYAFDEVDGSIIEKQLSLSGDDSGGWRRLTSDSRLQGVVGMVRGVAPPTGVLPVAPPTLLVTTAGSHCIFGIVVHSASSTYTPFPYLGSCNVSGDSSGNFTTGKFHSPRLLALTRSSSVLYVVDDETLSAFNFSENRLKIRMVLLSRLKGAVGAYLSPDEDFLFLLLRDGSIAPVKLTTQTYSTLGTVLRMAAGSMLGFSSPPSSSSMMAVAWTNSTSCSGSYLLATRDALAVAAPSGAGWLNVTWTVVRQIKAGALYVDGSSLLVIATRNASGDQTAGTEFLLLTSKRLPPQELLGTSTPEPSAPTTAGTGTTTRLLSTAAGESVSGDGVLLRNNTVPANATAGVSANGSSSSSGTGRLAGDASQQGSRLRDGQSSTAVPDVTGGSTAGYSYDADLTSSPPTVGSDASSDQHTRVNGLAASPTTTSTPDGDISAVATVSVATGRPVPSVSRGSLLSLGGASHPGLSGYGSADHGDVVLGTALSAAAVCVCLLVTVAVLLARRLRRSVAWNRRANVKLSAQDDYIILVPPGGEPSSGEPFGGCSASIAPLQEHQP